MNLITIFLSVLLVFTCGCTQPRVGEPGNDIWKGHPHQVLAESEVSAEIDEKVKRVQAFLDSESLDGILLTQVRNVNWITAGTANTQIVLNKDVGAASLLVKRDGTMFLICSGSESDRLMDQSLREQGYQLRMYRWFEANPVKDTRGDIIRELKGKIGSDVPFPGTLVVADRFKRLRFSLTDSEITRYRWLGSQTTDAISDVCRKVRIGMSEFEIEAMTATALRSRGILPTVLLVAVDERITKYRHVLPAGAPLKKYVMVNVVAEKWGMPVAVTRFAHFGELPAELDSKLKKTAKVNAHFQAATVPGKSCAELFEECKQWYDDAGYPDEWMKHHQGGAIGYDDREYVIYPGIQEVVQERQAFAWNPTITGAKVEDTMIAFNDHCEVVTRAENWPMIKIEVNGKTYGQPGVLIR
ncbi:MAG: M24 family metallopeptidase [Ignavibacteriae bacterium]|nr:M24 family metallopeptidase [Ignavibacteriota bacterium]